MKLKPKSINQLEDGCITFIKSSEYVTKFLQIYHERNIKGITIVTTEKIKELLDVNEEFIIAEDPRLIFAKIVNNRLNKEKPFIHPTAVIGENVQLGKDVTLHANVVIYGNTTIGNNVTIHANSVVGKPGFGYAKDEEDGTWVQFPQIGGVIIEDNVNIGSCVVVDKGALEDTVIGEGTKIDNLVHIAHGVKIGKNCLIIACAEISGSVKIGDNVWVAPNVSIRENLKIGSNSLIGISSVIIRDVPADSVIVGNPGKPISKAKLKSGKEV
ncbi:MAG: UDP-3-O-(3-hydroxymyristoyl)glucosamine N-acyltransferase [Candidatus Heimdallarchaeota archaeon]|nr:UDP-3-O-(3-hydroxymyristoyl)glucosamine N-acyltransferase [Candidatus Heimdallarchaeota archaeon]